MYGLGAAPDATQLQAEWSRLLNILHGLSVSISTEKARGNVAGVRAMLPYFQTTAAKMSDINRQLYGTDFTQFDNLILSTGQWIADSVKAIPNAIAAVPTGIGVGLLKAAVPFAALWLGFQWLTKGKAF